MPVAPRSAPGGHGRFPRTVASFFVPTPPQRDLQTLSDTVSETVTSTDTQSATVGIVVSVSESSSSLDTTNATTSFTSTVSESVTSTDTANATVSYVSSVSETSSSIETVSTTTAFSVGVTESSTFSNTASVSVDYVDAVSETTTSSDTSTASIPAVFDVSIEENLSTIDFVEFEEDIFNLGGRRVRREHVLDVVSSDINRVSYDDGDLKVKFKTGSTYQYNQVSPRVVEGFVSAKSPGKYLHNNVKGKYSYIKIK